MTPTRRDFIKGVGAASAIVLVSNDLVAQILADSKKGSVLESKFKGMADIVLGEAKLGGCSYADVRFTMTANVPGAMANFRTAADGAAGRGAGGGGRGAGGGGGGGGGRGGGGAGGGGGRGGRGGGAARGIPATDAERQAAGFGVRVIHSGVWGFASSPIVTEDEIRRVTRVAPSAQIVV